MSEPGRSAPAPEGWSVLPGVVDTHVHLGLVDHAPLARGAVVEVHDLGWVPEEILALRSSAPAGVRVLAAGPFLTAPGGYPTGRSWAPPGAVRALATAADAQAAVADAVGLRLDLVKVALHDQMPLIGDEVLRAVVAAAHAAGLRVAAHAEGRGQTARAVDAGVDILAHAPWTEQVPDDVLDRGRAMTWCSTLAIHDGAARAVAVDNIRRFRSAGGRIVYGTDMGNGPTPVGVNAAEILALGEAGLVGVDLLEALTGRRDVTDVPAERVLVSPHPLPTTAAEVAQWYADSHRLLRPEEPHAA